MRGFLKQPLGLLAAAVILTPAVCRAADVNASPTAKGIVGGALLGAEAVMLTEVAANVKPGWAYLVGGGLGAVAGGVGGYFAENSGDAKLSMYLLLGGMTLALPTTVAVLSTTAYEPANYTEDRPPPDEPVADPAQPEAPPISKPTSERRLPARPAVAARPLSPALVGVGGGALTLSIPAVEVRQAFTRLEVAQLGVKQQARVDVPVLNVVF